MNSPRSLVLSLVFFPALAKACPFCHTRNGELVRSGIFLTLTDPLNILAMILPFSVTIFLIYFFFGAEDTTLEAS